MEPRSYSWSPRATQPFGHAVGSAEEFLRQTASREQAWRGPRSYGSPPTSWELKTSGHDAIPVPGGLYPGDSRLEGLTSLAFWEVLSTLRHSQLNTW